MWYVHSFEIYAKCIFIIHLFCVRHKYLKWNLNHLHNAIRKYCHRILYRVHGRHEFFHFIKLNSDQCEIQKTIKKKLVEYEKKIGLEHKLDFIHHVQSHVGIDTFIQRREEKCMHRRCKILIQFRNELQCRHLVSIIIIASERLIYIY